MLRWIATGLLAALSAFVIVGNPLEAWRASREGRNYSSVPFVGGIAGALAVGLCPLGLSAWWALVPIALDLTFAMFVFALLGGAFRRGE